MSEQSRESTADENLDTGLEATDEKAMDDAIDEVAGVEAVELEVEEVGDAKHESTVRASESEQLRQQLLRLQADFDNFRKRTRQERDELQSFATRKLLGDLLPVVDNFDRAMGALTADDAELQTVRTGVEMVQRQLLTLLSQYDVRPMEAVGQAFDPKVHEAVLQEPAGDEPAGIVKEELQKGYFLGERVLRPAMVKVTV